MSEERVLVVPAAALESLGAIRGFCPEVERFLGPLLAGESLSYMDRSLAENDPSFKQLIPYAILRHQETLFSYRRSDAGGEERLRAKWSIGVGGHIASVDGDPGPEAYRQGFLRELREEVEIRGHFTERIIGLIYDDSTAVGRVHLGVVHLLDLEEPNAAVRDPAIAEGRLRPISELARFTDAMESWSSLAFAWLRGDGLSSGAFGG